jgi:hyperosmotically inducible periplasmic protein
MRIVSGLKAPTRAEVITRQKESDMKNTCTADITKTCRLLTMCALGVIVGALTVSAAAKGNATTPVDDIRHELLQLPYYGVFDFLSFKYDNGTVTLMGYADRPTLRSDAERAVRRVTGVDTVNDQVEVLPLSMNDDNLRWQTYYAIYRDPFLSRYAPGGGLLWGHRHAFPSTFLPLGPSRFPGTEPAGDYPIHIIVNNGRVTLLGVVDSESDKNVAGMRARGVPGSFGVDNELVVDNVPTHKSDTQ